MANHTTQGSRMSELAPVAVAMQRGRIEGWGRKRTTPYKSGRLGHKAAENTEYESDATSTRF